MGICTHKNKANFRQVSYVIKQTFICPDRTKKNPPKKLPLGNLSTHPVWIRLPRYEFKRLSPAELLRNIYHLNTTSSSTSQANLLSSVQRQHKDPGSSSPPPSPHKWKMEIFTLYLLKTHLMMRPMRLEWGYLAIPRNSRTWRKISC